MAFNVSDRTYEIYLNSRYDKSSDDSVSNWTSEFPQIPLNPNKTYQMALSSAQIPNICPQFHIEDSNFKIGDGVNMYDVHYDNSKIFNNIQEMLSYVSSIMNDAIAGILVSQDSDSRKTKIINNTGSDLILNFANSGSKNFFNKLGFDYPTNTTISNTLSIISSYYPSLVGTARFYIVCNDIKNNSFAKRSNSSNSYPIFKGLNANVGFGSFINFQSNNELYYHDLNTSNTINSLSFLIVDDRMRPIDLEGGSVLMTLFIREV
jgi:hypothetical protein